MSWKQKRDAVSVPVQKKVYKRPIRQFRCFKSCLMFINLYIFIRKNSLGSNENGPDPVPVLKGSNNTIQIRSIRQKFDSNKPIDSWVSGWVKRIRTNSAIMEIKL